MSTTQCRHIRPPGKRRTAGFTLLELMTTLTVAAIVLSVGVPSYLTMVRNSRAATNANELVTALTIARSEAVRRGSAVSICRSDDGSSCSGAWTDGWIVFVDGAATDSASPIVSQVLNNWAAPEGSASIVTLSNSTAVDLTWIRFMGRGDTRTTEAFPITFNLEIEDCTGDVARDIEINAVGRASVSTAACS